MSARNEATLPASRPRSRKSLGHIPSSHIVDQENITTDFGAIGSGKRAAMEKPSRKSRSKSIGPGGLDALSDTSGNRRKSLASIPQPGPRSILKPTMPPLPDIPAHRSSRKGSPKKTTPLKATESEDLIDFNIDPAPSAAITGTDNLPNPFQIPGSAAVNETRVTLRTEEEQQAAAREREEKERAELEKDVIARRDARRKSLANRRVSFAPEATLHTWDVVVEYQDSTTSSNSTRRASSASGGSVGSPHPQGPPSSDPLEAPSTPPEQVEEDTTSASPAHQRDLHQKKRRRSSGIPPMNFNNPDDAAFSSSPFSGDSAGDADEVIEEDDGSLSNSGSDDDDGTMMSLDGGGTTNMSMASIDSGESTGSSLEEALRLAARQAGTQGIDFDENGAGAPMEVEDEEVVASFKPWSKKAPINKLESQTDQENVNPFSPAFQANLKRQREEESEDEEMTMEMTHAVGGILADQEPDEDELSMDVTRAFGGIITSEAPKSAPSRRKSLPVKRRQSTRRRSSGESSSMGDESMDLTTAIGGIQPIEDETASNDDEEMTMEFTSAVGSVIKQTNPALRSGKLLAGNQPSKPARESLVSDGDETMEMTVAVGKIMASPTNTDSGEQDATVGMEMTTALGGILPPQRSFGTRAQAKKMMEVETNFDSSPFQVELRSGSPVKALNTAHTVASETGSPSLNGFRGKGLRRSAEARHSTTPKGIPSAEKSPAKKPSTPSKQVTPRPARATTPSKTPPPPKNVVIPTASPKRLFKAEIQAASTTPRSVAQKLATPNKLFQNDKNTGAATPSFILTPQPRRRSGLGLDRDGLGSPKVAALLDRRGSIGEMAKPFVPNHLEHVSPAVRFAHFEDPRAMEAEIDREREEEEDRENKLSILKREADQGENEKDATLNLKEMIESLTPKKKSLKGRKSLAVGAAKGLLGKRPAELDEDEEDENDMAVKRLKGREGSPVKTVRLQGPPSKIETTTGRITRASSRKSLDEAATITPTTMTSPEKSKNTTPRHQGRFKDVEASTATTQHVGPLLEKAPVDEPSLDEESLVDDRIRLQDFLNMTSIRFMELTLPKRRHTLASKHSAKDHVDDAKPIAWEDCVAAGAATLPMLDLFQHACSQLKKYVDEGKRTLRAIETSTFEENPPLFQEYISATPDLKILMDNQLKNGKTHARLLSKGQWYEWRMQLLRTVKEGLIKTSEEMDKDEVVLDRQQALLDKVLPHLIQQAEQLQREEADLQSAAEEIANCDQEELGDARQRLIKADAELEAKKRLIADMRRQLEGKEAAIKTGTERKQVCQDDIREAEKVREECRGWTSSEISVLKSKVDTLEQKYGWTITGVSDTTTSMTYRKEIELVFDPSSFLTKKLTPSTDSVNSRIDLWYIGANSELNPRPLTPEKDFFLQSIRDHIRGLPQAKTPVKNLLSAVSVSWNKANAVASDIQLLNINCSTETVKTSDNSMVVKSTLLIRPLKTKVQIFFQLTSQSDSCGFEVEITPSARVVYGERFNEPKMGEFLFNRCGNMVQEKGKSTKHSWGAAVIELGEKLLARGKK